MKFFTISRKNKERRKTLSLHTTFLTRYVDRRDLEDLMAKKGFGLREFEIKVFGLFFSLLFTFYVCFIYFILLARCFCFYVVQSTLLVCWRLPT